MSKRVTLKDIAREAGVTYQTVSKILLGSEINVSSEVRSRVEAIAAELGYVPNVTARNLRARNSYLIGYSWQLELPGQLNPVLEGFVQSIVDHSERAGYHILMFPRHPNEDMTAAYAELARTGRVDGFILSSLEYNDPRIPMLQQLNVPFVAFGQTGSRDSFPYVDVDNRAGMRMAVEHLLEQGHTRIGAIVWPETSRVGTDRLNGYIDAMQAAGLVIDPEWIKRGEGVFEHGYEATLELLALEAYRRPTAIVTLLDLLAIAAMRAVQECGLKVGHDVAIIGFDDVPIIQYLQPALTSVRQPVWEVGRCAVEMLISLVEHRPVEKQQILLPPDLIIRESSVAAII